LVREHHLARVTALLKSAGYLPRADLHPRSGGQYQFLDDSAGVFLALQTERTLRGFPVEATIQRAAEGTIELEVSGRRLRAISAEDALVHLCVSGAKGYWSQLRAIGNVAEVIEAPGVDWGSALRIAEELRCVRLLLLGAYVAHRVLRAGVSSEILGPAEADTHVRRLAESIVAQFVPTEANANSSGSGARRRAYFRVISRDTYWQGIVHALQLAASPSDMDREMIHLPGDFSPLYAIQRPWRLWREYGLRDRPGPDLAAYMPTPEPIVEQLLRFAEVGSGDVLYDLGCGDGRVVIRAATKYGIRAVGVDVNPRRILEARVNAERSGVADRVEFRAEDAKTTNVADATVVSLYLSPEGNLRLMERLREQLRPGSRIVAYAHGIAGWPAHAQEVVEAAEDGASVSLYLWRI
jgi:precorrin-6B methylase 2